MDPSIKVEYKPPSSACEQIGFMSKSTLVTHEQIINLRNAKVAQAVQITVKEQIPKSGDEKIKVSVDSNNLVAFVIFGNFELRVRPTLQS